MSGQTPRGEESLESESIHWVAFDEELSDADEDFDCSSNDDDVEFDDDFSKFPPEIMEAMAKTCREAEECLREEKDIVNALEKKHKI
jgi:hypothetical protein